LPQQTRSVAAYSTDVYDSVDAAAAQRVRSIIAANGQRDGNAAAMANGAAPHSGVRDAAIAARHIATGSEPRLR